MVIFCLGFVLASLYLLILLFYSFYHPLCNSWSVCNYTVRIVFIRFILINHVRSCAVVEKNRSKSYFIGWAHFLDDKQEEEEEKKNRKLMMVNTISSIKDWKSTRWFWRYAWWCSLFFTIKCMMCSHHSFVCVSVGRMRPCFVLFVCVCVYSHENGILPT